MNGAAALFILVMILGLNVVLLVMFANLCSNVRAIREAAETTARAVTPRPVPPPVPPSYQGQR